MVEFLVRVFYFALGPFRLWELSNSSLLELLTMYTRFRRSIIPKSFAGAAGQMWWRNVE